LAHLASLDPVGIRDCVRFATKLMHECNASRISLSAAIGLSIRAGHYAD
jgi:hypothetical protein